MSSNENRKYIRRGFIMLAIGVIVSLGTYQFQHHGLWGKLVNYNKTPLLVIKGTKISGDNLQLVIYRPNGPDTYGSFVEKVTVTVPGSPTPIATWLPANLKSISKASIHNVYPFERVKKGPWGLVVPLSAKASVQLPINPTAASTLQQYRQVDVTVEDVSGLSWSTSASVTS